MSWARVRELQWVLKLQRSKEALSVAYESNVRTEVEREEQTRAQKSRLLS